MTPLQYYTDVIDRQELTPDAEQRAVILKLDSIHQDLIDSTSSKHETTGFFNRLFARREAPPQTIKGLYLWGGVGRGKTYLTDIFYASVPLDAKTRLHYHHFMKMIHDELKPLKEVENPLLVIADQWINKTRLLVLDEMHVNDITDAMLLGGLLTAMFERGMTLVTTSNVAPDNLYRDGLQRDRFLPAIEQIKRHTEVFEIHGETDYRLRALESGNTYLLNSDPAARQELANHFDRLSTRSVLDTTKTLKINRRELNVIRVGEGIAWFTFDELCNTPRSTHDYIDIATVFHTIIISDIPVLDDTRNDEARRLVNLVDELYDRGVNLIASAEALPDDLYQGTRLEFEFVRAASRLREMQTVEYLAQRNIDNQFRS